MNRLYVCPLTGPCSLSLQVIPTSSATKPYSKLCPIRLLTVGFHEMSHAFAVSSHAPKSTQSNSIVHPQPYLLCHLLRESIADEGGATRMSGGIPLITLPAGYLGSSFIGACLIACGFNTNASKVATLVMAVFFLFTLWWARRNLMSVFREDQISVVVLMQSLELGS